jgi:ABC-type sugar transport system permease subunit
MNLQEKKRLKGYLIILPVILIFVVIFIYPLIKSFIYSFTDNSLYVENISFVGLSNYISIFTEGDFWTAVLHSFILVFFVVSIQYILGMILAHLLNEDLKGFGWFTAVLMIPWVTPRISTVIMFDWMSVTKYGLFNMILEFFKLGNYTTYWFGNIKFAFPMIILMFVWRNTCFNALILYAGLKTVPQHLYESAQIDGASGWQRFRHITLPSLKHSSMVVIVLHIMSTFNNFDMIYLSTGGGPVGATEVLATSVYKTAWSYYQFGRAASIGVVMMLVLMVFTIIYIRLVKE